MNRRFLLALAIFPFLIARPTGVEACSEGPSDDVMINRIMPDDLASFYRGRLGILQAGYDSNEYAVAYRYLNGGKLSVSQQILHCSQDDLEYTANYTKACDRNLTEERTNFWATSDKAGDARKEWFEARGNSVPEQEKYKAPGLDVDSNGNVGRSNDPRCPNAAFQTATATLEKRAALWGKMSSWTLDWIHAQDAVFANCEDAQDGMARVASRQPSIPQVAPAQSPQLLVADRAYQTAAAEFYAGHFDDAEQRFMAIAADRESPWREWGNYLVARTLVRKAFALGKPTDSYDDLADFDLPTMQLAQQMLEVTLKEEKSGQMRNALQAELNYIRIRTETNKRLAEICAALAGPASDPEFTQHLFDLNWALIKRAMKAKPKYGFNITEPPPLLAWIDGWRSSDSAAIAYARWKPENSLPWFVLSIAKSKGNEPFVPELLTQAQKITPASPAYDTVFFHQVRLLIALRRTDEARTLLDSELKRQSDPTASSRINALRSERAAIARNFQEFLGYAGRSILYRHADAEGNDSDLCEAKEAEEWSRKSLRERLQVPQKSQSHCDSQFHPDGFDTDALLVLNRQTPLTLLAVAATAPGFSPALRQQIAMMVWTRADALQNEQIAEQMVPLLPKKLRDEAGPGLGYRADLAILRNGGLRPYLDKGVPRIASYDELDHFRDNWWNKNLDHGWAEQSEKGYSLSFDGISKPALAPAAALFLSREQITDGETEYAALSALPEAPTLIGQRIIDYLKQHPSEPSGPEALALVVRATRYFDHGGSYKDQDEFERLGKINTATSKAAFVLLHHGYPKSPWAAITKYYY